MPGLELSFITSGQEHNVDDDDSVPHRLPESERLRHHQIIITKKQKQNTCIEFTDLIAIFMSHLIFISLSKTFFFLKSPNE